MRVRSLAAMQEACKASESHSDRIEMAIEIG